MTTSVIATANWLNGSPVGRPKLSRDIVPSGSWQYVVLPAVGANDSLMVNVATDANVSLDVVGLTEEAQDNRAVAVRVPAASIRDYQFYAKGAQRLAYKTLA